MRITEKELLEILDNGICCLNERRQIDYNIAKELQDLLLQDKIHIEIKCIHGTFGGIEKCMKCNKEVKTMKHLIIEQIDMIKCSLNHEYILLSNCCYCKLNELDKENENYVYCKYKV